MTLIVGVYDGGYDWEVKVGEKRCCRHDADHPTGDLDADVFAKFLHNAICSYDKEAVVKVVKFLILNGYDIDHVVWVEDGSIAEYITSSTILKEV